MGEAPIGGCPESEGGIIEGTGMFRFPNRTLEVITSGGLSDDDEPAWYYLRVVQERLKSNPPEG